MQLHRGTGWRGPLCRGSSWVVEWTVWAKLTLQPFSASLLLKVGRDFVGAGGILGGTGLHHLWLSCSLRGIELWPPSTKARRVPHSDKQKYPVSISTGPLGLRWVPLLPLRTTALVSKVLENTHLPRWAAVNCTTSNLSANNLVYNSKPQSDCKVSI